MTTTNAPDLFTNVHKGIRRALFAACTALGNAGGDEARENAARLTLNEALSFVAHHGDNEDVLLLPLLRDRAKTIFDRMTRDHHSLDEARAALVTTEDFDTLYLAACAFTARYLAHMDQEEREFQPEIRAVLSFDEMLSFGRQSIVRTAPADQKMMLTWMLPAITRADADEFLGRLPPQLAAELRAGRDA